MKLNLNVSGVAKKAPTQIFFNVSTTVKHYDKQEALDDTKSLIDKVVTMFNVGDNYTTSNTSIHADHTLKEFITLNGEVWYDENLMYSYRDSLKKLDGKEVDGGVLKYETKWEFTGYVSKTTINFTKPYTESELNHVTDLIDKESDNGIKINYHFGITEKESAELYEEAVSDAFKLGDYKASVIAKNCNKVNYTLVDVRDSDDDVSVSYGRKNTYNCEASVCRGTQLSDIVKPIDSIVTISFNLTYELA